MFRDLEADSSDTNPLFGLGKQANSVSLVSSHDTGGYEHILNRVITRLKWGNMQNTKDSTWHTGLSHKTDVSFHFWEKKNCKFFKSFSSLMWKHLKQGEQLCTEQNSSDHKYDRNSDKRDLGALDYSAGQRFV